MRSRIDRWCGVRRINVSLDTLNPEKFQAITRWGKFDKVMEGVSAAVDAGLAIKINCVASKVSTMTKYTIWCIGVARMDDLTFIEVMPMGDIGGELRLDQYWPLSMVRGEVAEALDAQRE